jgi:hypothetical protein
MCECRWLVRVCLSSGEMRGSFAALKDDDEKQATATARTTARATARATQIPFGNDRKKSYEVCDGKA